jgi:hypothetical protein
LLEEPPQLFGVILSGPECIRIRVDPVTWW